MVFSTPSGFFLYQTSPQKCLILSQQITINIEPAEIKGLKWELDHRWTSRTFSFLPGLGDHCRREVRMSLRAWGGGWLKNKKNSKTSTFQMQHFCTNELRAVVGKHTQNLCYLKPDKMPAQMRAEHISKWTPHPMKVCLTIFCFF